MMPELDDVTRYRVRNLIRQMWDAVNADRVERVRLLDAFRDDLPAIKCWVASECLGLEYHTLLGYDPRLDATVFARLAREVPGVVAFVARQTNRSPELVEFDFWSDVCDIARPPSQAEVDAVVADFICEDA
jgi:hypothetical protein